jgi:hypothetical protein
MGQSENSYLIALVFVAACSPRDGAHTTDSVVVVRLARAALPSDTGGPMRVGFYQRDSAGALVEFEVTPPTGMAALGGSIMVRVRAHGAATVVRRGR